MHDEVRHDVAVLAVPFTERQPSGETLNVHERCTHKRLRRVSPMKNVGCCCFAHFRCWFGSFEMKTDIAAHPARDRECCLFLCAGRKKAAGTPCLAYCRVHLLRIEPQSLSAASYTRSLRAGHGMMPEAGLDLRERTKALYLLSQHAKRNRCTSSSLIARSSKPLLLQKRGMRLSEATGGVDRG